MGSTDRRTAAWEVNIYIHVSQLFFKFIYNDGKFDLKPLLSA
jgi:hypothetical protein